MEKGNYWKYIEKREAIYDVYRRGKLLNMYIEMREAIQDVHWKGNKFPFTPTLPQSTRFFLEGEYFYLAQQLLIDENIMNSIYCVKYFVADPTVLQTICSGIAMPYELKKTVE